MTIIKKVEFYSGWSPGEIDVEIRVRVTRGDSMSGVLERFGKILGTACDMVDAPEAETGEPEQAKAPAEEPAKEEPKPASRRRRKAAEKTEESASEPAKEEPKTSRRRRSASKTEDTKAASEPAKEEPKRRRRSAKPAETGEKTISDADVAKAASEAAAVVSPEVVKQIITEDFGTENTASLTQEQRAAFLKTLEDEMRATDGAAAENG